MAPRVCLVAVPGVEKLGFDFSGEFLIWCLRDVFIRENFTRRRKGAKKDAKKKGAKALRLPSRLCAFA